jgi:molecular chaperone GrpE
MPEERREEEVESTVDSRQSTVESQDEAAPDVNGAAPAEAEDKAAEYLELAQRTQADFENFRKRAAKDMAAAGARAKAGLIRELLPVVDNLERALGAVESDDNGVTQGLKLVFAELEGVLSRNGVVAMEPAGEAFDPTVHEAISTMPAEGAEPGTVVDVVEKGYKLGDTVIRPARVVVAA